MDTQGCWGNVEQLELKGVALVENEACKFELARN